MKYAIKWPSFIPLFNVFSRLRGGVGVGVGVGEGVVVVEEIEVIVDTFIENMFLLF